MQRSVEKQTLLTGPVHLANLSVKLGGSGIFEQRKTLTTRKISCDEEPILAAKTASHEIFRGRFVRFVVQKEFHRVHDLVLPVSVL